jgi:hypothetical protein
MTVAIPATSMLKARLGSNAMRHFWWQSSDGVDLDQKLRLRPFMPLDLTAGVYLPRFGFKR